MDGPRAAAAAADGAPRRRARATLDAQALAHQLIAVGEADGDSGDAKTCALPPMLHDPPTDKPCGSACLSRALGAAEATLAAHERAAEVSAECVKALSGKPEGADYLRLQLDAKPSTDKRVIDAYAFRSQLAEAEELRREAGLLRARAAPLDRQAWLALERRPEKGGREKGGGRRVCDAGDGRWEALVGNL